MIGLPINNGRIYRSKYAAFQVLIRPRRDVWGGPDKTILVDQIPDLTAEFGKHNGEVTMTAPDGSEITVADILGYYFDSAQQAEEKGWSQEEHDLVVKVLDRECEKNPEAVWIHTLPVAAAPWPTYDDTHHKQVPGLAEQLGLVAEALAYEKQNKNRGEVVEKLTELANAVGAEEELTAA